LNCNIGHALKRLRSERGLTQKDLAALVSGGLDYTYIGKIERGEQLPSLKILIGISEALGVPVGIFFGGESAAEAARLRVVQAGKAGELEKELRVLHPDDLPLVVEIVRLLNRHRRAERKKAYQTPAGSLPLAAEDGPSYSKP
jgi:transcriptional regulator with XRE-family HTH domain